VINRIGFQQHVLCKPDKCIVAISEHAGTAQVRPFIFIAWTTNRPSIHILSKSAINCLIYTNFGMLFHITANLIELLLQDLT